MGNYWLPYLLQTNIYSIIILVIILISLRQYKESLNLGNNIFKTIIIVDIILMALDIFSCLIEGRPGAWVTGFYYATQVISLVIAPSIGVLWFYFINVLIQKQPIPIQKKHLWFLLPFFINAFLAVYSLFGNSLFYIDEDNVYHRGHLFFVYILVAAFYFIISFVVMIVKRKSIRKSNFIPLHLFLIPPLIGAVLQSLYYGLLLTWQTIALSILLVFVFVQSENVVTDYLTGLYNKREFEKYLSTINKSSYRFRKLGGIFFDLDNFKQINDQFGHLMGDFILREIGNILRQSFRRTDFLARIGGDEFVAFFEISHKEDIRVFQNRLLANVSELNKTNKLPFIVSISMGIDCFDAKSPFSIHEFFAHLDKLLYEQKEQKPIFHLHPADGESSLKQK